MTDTPRDDPTSTSTDAPGDPSAQREQLHESMRRANAPHPDNFQDEAVTDKVVRIEPDGIGPTSTGTLDTPEDQRKGSGNDAPA